MVNCRPIYPRVLPGFLPLVLLSLVQPVQSQAQATPSAAQSAQVTVLALPSALQTQLEKLGAAHLLQQVRGNIQGARKVTKVEALRKAQLGLLRGKVHTEAAADVRGFATETAVSESLKGYAILTIGRLLC